MQQAAVELIPDLAALPIEHHWAGLRPGSPDGVPVIGPHPDISNLYICAGHFRNGVVLVYGTAGNGPNVQPADATIDNPPADLFTKAGWAEFASGFWLGGCGGAAFAWFLCDTALVSPLVNIAGGVWSVG